MWLMRSIRTSTSLSLCRPGRIDCLNVLMTSLIRNSRSALIIRPLNKARSTGSWTGKTLKSSTTHRITFSVSFHQQVVYQTCPTRTSRPFDAALMFLLSNSKERSRRRRSSSSQRSKLICFVVSAWLSQTCRATSLTPLSSYQMLKEFLSHAKSSIKERLR